MRLVLAMAVLAACGGDDTMMMMPADAAASDGDIIAPTIAVDFAPVPASIEMPVTEHVRGPDGRIYGLRPGFLVASNDGGQSFTVVGGSNGSYVAATSSSVFTLGQGPLRLIRFANGNGTQSLLTAPADALYLAATPTTLWIESVINGGSAAPELYRSTDQGDSFTEVTPPPAPTNNRWNLYTGGEYLFLESNGRVYRTQTGASWDDLGTIPMLRTFAATHAGTALAIGTPGNYALYRRAVADSTWSQSADLFGAFQMSQRENGELVRINVNTGGIEVSSTDGASWTAGPAASLVSCQVIEHQAFDSAILGTCFDTSSRLNIRLPATATQWIREEPDGLPYPQLASFTDVSFSDAGKIVLAGKKRLFISDNGTSWRRSTYAPDATWPIDAVAMTPNGQRIFVGSTAGRYAFLDGNGAVTHGPSTLGPADEHVSQADFSDDQMVFVTTANAQNTAGTVRDGIPDRIGIWNEWNPHARMDNPQFDPTAGFHGVQACPYAGSTMLVVGVQQWFGTNAYQTGIRVKYQLGSYIDPFMDIDAPVSPHVPSSFSCSPNGTHSMTFGDEHLYVGNFVGPTFRRVESTGMSGKLVAAKFAPDNRLWVITDTGVFRSTLPVDAH